jgi:branched-chain amino acid aminotransferase
MAFLFYFGSMKSICFNGKIISADLPVLFASNRGYRYGDGLFETMKVTEGKIQLANYHFERLFSGLSLLQFEKPALFTRERITAEIIRLCGKNECTKLARVRLSVFRGNGGLYDDNKVMEYLIECWPLNESVNKLNENGLVLDVYRDAEKGCDKFSNLKSANFLPYYMAALFAEQNKLNDCLVMNNKGGIADSTIASLFIIKNGIVITPGLENGCINGVMRRHLISELPVAGYVVQESTVSVSDVLMAEEVFLTNAIHTIRWVRQFSSKMYTNVKTTEIYERLIKTIHT